jgi:basic amino acid/polyamine antiporter, APA family
VIRRRADAPAGFYRVPGYPVVPAFFVLAAIVAVASAIMGYPKESLLGTLLLAAGAVVFLVMNRQPS